MSTQPDPVAEKSGFLRMYMSNHPDTLVGYAKWYGKVKEVITGAEMTAIDTKVRVLLAPNSSPPLLILIVDTPEYDVTLHSQEWCQERGLYSYRPSPQWLRGCQAEASRNEGTGSGRTGHGESNLPDESYTKYNTDHRILVQFRHRSRPRTSPHSLSLVR